MRFLTPARARAAGVLLLEAAGIVLLIAQQRHEQRIRRQSAILDFAGRLYDMMKKATP
jgi:hypothetical protein